MVVVGELNADLILTGDVIPEFGQVEKVLDDAVLALGSSSAIFACGVARLGLRVAFIGKIGDDVFGHFVRCELEGRGVDTSGVVMASGIKTGLTVILSRGSDRAMLTHLGSIAALRYEEVNQALLTRARHLHLGSYFLLDALRPDIPRLFDDAHSHNLTVSLDTNYDPTERWNGDLREALARTDIFLPNEIELRAITSQTEIEPALKMLVANWVPLVAAKLGPGGAIAQRGSELARAEALSISVVDTTGAGDSFDAGFIYGYLAGWELSQMLRLGCVCGSLSTRAAGGTAAQATLAEVMAVM